MLTALIILGIFVLAWPVVGGAVRPASAATRRSDADRRARYVARHPHEVNLGDIRRTLKRGGLSPDQVEFVTGRAVELGIGPFTLMLWLKRFDATALATVVAADLSQETLIAHVVDGTVPDLEGLSVFAEFNGYGAETTHRHPKKWAMENGAPVTLETLGLFNAAPVTRHKMNESDAA